MPCDFDIVHNVLFFIVLDTIISEFQNLPRVAERRVEFLFGGIEQFDIDGEDEGIHKDHQLLDGINASIFDK